MISTLRFRSGVIWSAWLLALLVMSIALVGCGGDEPTQAVARIERSEDGATATVSSPREVQIATSPVTTELVEPVVAEPEPPKEVSFEEAQAAFFERRYDESVELFTRYSERKSENPWGYYMLGLSAWKADDNDKAEIAFEQALELDPKHVKSWLNLSRVLLDSERAEGALVKIDEALSIDPNSGVARRLKGRAYHQLGRMDEAIESYREALLVDGQDVWSMNNMGLIMIEQERFDEAAPPLARAVEIKDDVAIFQNNLGIALERTGHFRAAEEAYKAALAVDETHERAFVSLGRVESLEVDSSVEPLDLAQLAQAFVDLIEGWREPVALTEEVELEPVEPETVEPAPIAVARTDSIPDSKER